MATRTTVDVDELLGHIKNKYSEVVSTPGKEFEFHTRRDLVDMLGTELLDALPEEVTGIEVEPERRVKVDRFQRPLRRHDVVGDLSRVDFQGKLHALFLKDIKDRRPPRGKVRVPGVDVPLPCRREEVEIAPDRAAGEAIDHTHAQLRSGPRSRLHLF